MTLPRHFVHFLTVLIIVAAAGCARQSSDPGDTATRSDAAAVDSSSKEAESPAVDPAGLVVSVMSGELNWSADATTASTLTVDDLVNADAGDVLLAGEGTMGLLTAEGRFSAELVADSELEIVSTSSTEATLSLKHGAGRYTMANAAAATGPEPFMLTVRSQRRPLGRPDPRR